MVSLIVVLNYKLQTYSKYKSAPSNHKSLFTFYAGKVRELRVLVNELNTVTQWYLLGVYLGLHPSTLDAIKKNCTDTKECCTHMLIEWQECVIPTWSAVVKALMGIGRDRLASHLAAKYGMLNLHFDLTRFLLFALLIIVSTLFYRDFPSRHN